MSDAMVIDSLEVETFSCIVVCTLQGKKGKGDGLPVRNAQCLDAPKKCIICIHVLQLRLGAGLLMLLCSTVTGAL